MNLHNICLWGPAFPSEPAHFADRQRRVWSVTAGTGACAGDGQPGQWSDSLDIYCWETCGENSDAFQYKTFFWFHFRKVTGLGAARSLTCNWLIPFSLPVLSPCPSNSQAKAKPKWIGHVAPRWGGIWGLDFISWSWRWGGGWIQLDLARGGVHHQSDGLSPVDPPPLHAC